MQPCNPLRARLWFTWKPRLNFAASIIVFVILLFGLSYLFEFWIAAVIAAAVSFCFHFFFLDHQTITLECPNCLNYIETDTPWLCGFHQCKNENVLPFPFINKCEHCGQQPKAYECHHCHRLIHFTKDRQKAFFARRLTEEELEPPVPEDKIGKKIAEQYEAIRDLRHKFKIARLETNIEIEQKRAIGPEEISLFDSTLRELEQMYEQKMTKENAAEYLREKIRKRYWGKADEIERRIAVVDRIMTDGLE